MINTSNQGEDIVIERLGKKRWIKKNGGLFFAIPCGIDTLSYVVNMKEQSILITPLHATTQDNFSVQVSGNVFIQFVDAEKAAYGATDPIAMIDTYAQAVMRTAIGKMTYDHLSGDRGPINEEIRVSLATAAAQWGMKVLRYEITNVDVTPSMRVDMELQGSAERQRRANVTTAEGLRDAAIQTSRGAMQAKLNATEADAQSMLQMAQAEKKKVILAAEAAKADAMLRAEGTAVAMQTIMDTLNAGGVNAMIALQYKIASELIEMQGKIGERSNTIYFNQHPADLTALLAQAQTMVTVQK